MNASSSEVIDAVAAEIKHYMDVTRKEDGFDLSGPQEPKRAYPPLKMIPMLSYGKLQDRSLKHYFTPSMIRTHIANLEAVPPGSPREKTVRRRLNRKMKQYTKNNSSHNTSSISQKLSEDLYTAQLEALSLLHAETQNRYRRKVFQGPTVLRRSIPPNMSRGEAVRLVNRSSQILVATETVALAHDILSQRHNLSMRPQSAPSSWSNGLPGLYYSPERPKTARGKIGNDKAYASTPKNHHRKPKYIWDINGRKTLNLEYEDSIDDDPSSSYSVSTSSMDIDAHGRRHKGYHRHSRPMSAMALPHKLHVSYSERPVSAGGPQTQEHFPRPRPRKMVSPDSGFSVDAVTQTRSRRRPAPRIRQAFMSASDRSSEDEVKLCKYRVEIRTGDRLGAGTTADIYLSLHGDETETDEVYLTNPIGKNRKYKPFKRGQTDIFEIEAENVGGLQKIGIGHDRKDKGCSWFLDSVKIENDQQSWFFHCKAWLSGSLSKRKTFRHFMLDHSSSESSGSDSSDVTSSASETAKEKSKKLVRRKSSTASSHSNKSSHSSKSWLSSGSDEQFNKAPPVVSVQPPTPTSSGHTLVDRNDSPHHSSSQSSKSSLEYSSDSTLGGGRVIKEDESFLEESEDTRSHFTSTTSDSDTLTESGGSGDEKTAPNQGSFAAPFSVDSLLFSNRERQNSVSSSSSSENSIEANVEVDKQFLDKSSSSSHSNLSSSSSNEEEITKVRPKLEKRFTNTVPLEVNLETADYVTTPRLVTADVTTAETPLENSIMISDNEILKSTSETIENSSSSSTSDDESDGESSSELSSSIKQIEIPETRKLSLGEPDPLVTSSVLETPDFFVDAGAKELAREVAEKKIESTKEERSSPENYPLSGRLSSSSSSSLSRKSSSSSSSSDDQDDEDVRVRDDAADHVSDDAFATEADAIAKSDRVVVEEKADAFMDGFNAGVLAVRKLSITNPVFLDEETPKTFDIDESLQSDEEGVVQSPSHPTIRGDIHNLIKEGEVDKVTEVITLRPELLEKTNENGWSPIHVAATHGQLEILQWLTTQHANLKAETPTGYTAMHMASMHGHIECVKALHEMGADIDAINVDDQTPLHLACMSGHLEMAKWLVTNNANLLAKDNFQRTALDLSKQYQHKEVTQFLKTCLRDLKQRNSSTSLRQSSKSSIDSARSSSSSSSSSSEDDEKDEKHSESRNDSEEAENDKLTEMASHNELEEKKKMYEKQQKKMVRRRSSFLDVIRNDAQNLENNTLSSSSDSESSSSSSSN